MNEGAGILPLSYILSDCFVLFLAMVKFQGLEFYRTVLNLVISQMAVDIFTNS